VPNGKAFDPLTGFGFGDWSEGEVVFERADCRLPKKIEV
jgi:hypothetical protein